MEASSPPAEKTRTPQPIMAADAFSSLLSKLSGSSRSIPFEKDFHFYNNFDEFKVPIRKISQESESMLEAIGSAAQIWGKEIAFPATGDLDDGYDWLVNVNDEVFERFDGSVDEFQKVRKKEEESGKRVMELDDGFQLIGQFGNGSDTTVKVATTKAKPKVPFHIPTIRKPQEEFNILVDNSNQPFDHVWLQRGEDEQRFIHPLEKLSILDFVDKDIGDIEPTKPPSLESTPFKLVEDVKGLKELAAKLCSVNEFAVDLEHNQYRSFQGLTCLMQISTRTEDFIVDTLKLRIHVGPYLREVFKDPTKKKVMHGADRDIIWLQRDFGIYICNMFDTGQASRVLNLERNSLEYLLQHFCGVTANKEYQNADWRLRPLPDEMVRYAREDTHYLLYIYDVMKKELFSMPKASANVDVPLLEVYKRSSDLCMQLYEKELLTENSFLYIYGLQVAGLNAQQLAVAAGLCEWRDGVARAEDESTGYILPNKTLLEIAKKMPITTNKLRRLVKSKHSYIERNLASIVSVIRHSMRNGSAFESVVEHLRQGQLETISEEIALVDGGFEANPRDASEQSRTESVHNTDAVSGNIELSETSECLVEDGQVKIDHANSIPSSVFTIPVQSSDTKTNPIPLFHSPKVTGATVEALKKPNRAFGALLGNSASKRKFDANKKDKEDIKLEQIRSSVNLPFRSFVHKDDDHKSVQEEPPKASGNMHLEDSSEPVTTTIAEEIIMLDANDANTEDGNSEIEIKNDESPEKNVVVEPMSLSEERSRSGQSRKARTADACEDSGRFLQLKPFDYEEARKQMRYGDSENSGPRGDAGGGRSQRDSGGRKKGSASRLEDGEFPQGRRRQAFPATGNRSATFR